MSEATPAQQAQMDQAAAEVKHLVEGARLARAAIASGGEQAGNVIGRIIAHELSHLEADELRMLLITMTAMFADHLNDVHGPPLPMKGTVDEAVADLPEEFNMVILRSDADGKLQIPPDLPERVMGPLQRLLDEINHEE